MRPRTAIYVSSYYRRCGYIPVTPDRCLCICVLPLHYYYISSVLILLCMCPRTTGDAATYLSRPTAVSIYVSSHYITTIYLAPSYCYICVLVLQALPLHTCHARPLSLKAQPLHLTSPPSTASQVSYYVQLYMCVKQYI